MSFSVASYRHDKTSDMFGPSYEEFDTEFFNQFVNFNPSNFGNHSHECSCAPAESKILERKLSYSNLDDSSDISSHDDEVKHSKENGFYSELSGRAAISDSELLSLEEITLEGPITPAFTQSSLPSTPHPSVAVNSRRKAHLVESLSCALKKATNLERNSLERTLRSPIKKQRHANHRQTELDSLGSKLHLDALKFKFDFEESPTTVSFNQKTKNDRSIEVVEEPSTPAQKLASPLDISKLRGQHSRKISDYNNCLPVPSELQSSASFWPQRAPQMAMKSNFEDALLVAQEEQPPMWWNHASKTPMVHPLPSGFHTNPQFATKSLALQLQNDVVYQENREYQYQQQHPQSLLMRRTSVMASNHGLVIQLPCYSSNHRQQHQAFVSGNSRIQGGYYDSIPQHRHHRRAQTQSVPQQSPRKDRRTRNTDTASPSSSSSNFQVKKRKSPSTPRTKSCPRTPTSSSHKPRKPTTPSSKADGRNVSAGGLGDFVNYTPSDSKKILTGVAPSGSSKTKARREKEAMEKRRRLSQAAARAILQAGGSVEGLDLGFEGMCGEEGVYV